LSRTLNRCGRYAPYAGKGLFGSEGWGPPSRHAGNPLEHRPDRPHLVHGLELVEHVLEGEGVDGVPAGHGVGDQDRLLGIGGVLDIGDYPRRCRPGALPLEAGRPQPRDPLLRGLAVTGKPEAETFYRKQTLSLDFPVTLPYICFVF